MTIKEFKKLDRAEQWEMAKDYMARFTGYPEDTNYLMEQIEEEKGGVYDEFVEYLETKI